MLSGALMPGCGTKRVDIIPVRIRPPPPPALGVPVRIERVEDLRVFKELPKPARRKSADPKTWATYDAQAPVPQLLSGDIGQFTFDATLEIRSELDGFSEGRRVRGEVTRYSYVGAYARSHRSTITSGLEDLMGNLRAAFMRARPAVEPPAP